MTESKLLYSEKRRTYSISSFTILISFFLIICSLFFVNNGLMFLFPFSILFLLIIFFKLRIKNVFYFFPNFPLLLFFIITLNSFFYTDENPIFHFYFLNFSYLGLRIGLLISLRIILILAYTNCLTLLETPLSLVGALELLFRPLTFIHLPIKKITDVMSFTILFIPNLTKECQKILRAQKIRGKEYSRLSFFFHFDLIHSVIIPVFISSFRTSEDIALALYARGYEGKKKTFVLNFKKLDFIVLTFFVLYLIFSIFLGRVYGTN